MSEGERARTPGAECAAALKKKRRRTDHKGMAIVRTSAFVTGIRGSAGNVTYVETPFGTSIRDRVIPRDPRTPAQAAARERMTLAARAWKSLTLAEARAWREYAAALDQQPPWRPAKAQTRFVELAIRFLQVNPQGTIPRLPPATPFAGDGLVVSVEGLTGAVRFAASQPNSPDVTTELLVQRLVSVHRRTYLERYRTQGFHAFGPPAELPLRSGLYACAVRFVRVSTGQATGLVELGLVEVG